MGTKWCSRCGKLDKQIKITVPKKDVFDMDDVRGIVRDKVKDIYNPKPDDKDGEPDG